VGEPADNIAEKSRHHTDATSLIGKITIAGAKLQ
jgi:hypothetical protein